MRCPPLLVAALALLLTAPLTSAAPPTSEWSCSTVSNTTLGHNVFWVKHNCTGTVSTPTKSRVGPIIVNIVHALLSDDAASPQLRPAVGHTPLGLAKLHELAATATAPTFTRTLTLL